MMQAVRLTVQTCFIVQAQAQTGTFLIYVYLFNSRKLIVTQSCLETFATKRWIVQGWNLRRDNTA